MSTAAVPSGRRERKKEATKQRIFEAALALFHQKGFDSTTIDDISERADVAKGTFFNYFPRKESVVEFLADEWMRRAEAAATQPGRPALERIRELYQVLARAHESQPGLSRAIMHAAVERMCCPLPGGTFQRFEELVTRVLREGQQSGELRVDQPPDVLHGVLMSCFVGSVMWWLGDHSRGEGDTASHPTLCQVVQALQGVALDGMQRREAA